MAMMHTPLWLAGSPAQTGVVLEVVNPYTKRVVGTCHQAGPAEIETALAGLASAQTETARLPTYKRYEVLQSVAAGIKANAAGLAALICAESGKPIRYAEAEVARAVQTFSLAADYIRSAREELLPLDLSPGLEGRRGLVRRVPVGPVLGIAPFNFPLNLVAHKLAPAIAAGCAFLLKPASATPLTALRLAELIVEAGYPPQAVNVLPFPARLGDTVVQDPRTSLLSFTGSDVVGWPMKAKAGRKKVVLELGGDAAALVASDADLETAAQQCAVGAFAYAGQVCISIQRIVVEKPVYEAFRASFLTAVRNLGVGDPADATTVSGPLIDAGNLLRVRTWLDEAIAAGATYATEGAVDEAHNLIHPTVLENVPRTTRLTNEEVFAPVVELIAVDGFEEGLQAVNASRYGLQAGVFTQNEANIRRAWEVLHVGGILVNAAPTLRIDAMPYGGVKDSGFGREGTRYAYEDYTEPRLLVW